MLSSFTKFKYKMSNILVIKHGSLGDIVQISGVLRDIRETHIDKKIFILTTMPYVEVLSRCPFLDGVLMGFGSIVHHLFDDFSMFFASLFRDHFFMFFCFFRIDF